jgi:hypothetical protein
MQNLNLTTITIVKTTTVIIIRNHRNLKAIRSQFWNYLDFS